MHIYLTQTTTSTCPTVTSVASSERSRWVQSSTNHIIRAVVVFTARVKAPLCVWAVLVISGEAAWKVLVCGWEGHAGLYWNQRERPPELLSGRETGLRQRRITMKEHHTERLVHSPSARNSFPPMKNCVKIVVTLSLCALCWKYWGCIDLIYDFGERLCRDIISLPDHGTLQQLCRNVYTFSSCLLFKFKILTP